MQNSKFPTVIIFTVLLVVIAVVVGIYSTKTANSEDVESPTLVITGPEGDATIGEGDTIVFTATYDDDVEVASIWLSSGAIVMDGFEARTNILMSENTVTITLEDVQVTQSQDGYTFAITGGTAADADGNLSNSATSPVFYVTQ